MTGHRATFRQSDAQRALKAAVKAGLQPSSYTISPKGEIVVSFGDASAAAKRNPLDRLLER